MLDQVVFVFLGMCLIFAPALLLLVWVCFSKSDLAKRRLRTGFVIIAAIPPLMAAAFALFLSTCASGGIDRSFSGCGFVPDWLAGAVVNLTYPILLLAAGCHVLLACRAEFLDWKRRRQP